VLAAAQVPASLQVDGQLTEWPVFADGKPTPLTPSFVAVTATADAVVLIGRVRNLPAQGLWLRLETEAPELPPIGTFERGGGIIPLNCDAPNDPNGAGFDVESCRRLMEGYEELQKGYAAMFERQLHLTTQAVSVRTGEQEQPVAGAKYAARVEEGAVTFEAVLPLSVLPRTAGAELASLFVTPERADSAAPHGAPADGLQSVAFARPLRFGVDSEVLTCLMQMNGMGMPRSPRFSYQPGVPNRVHRVGSRGFDLEMTEVTLSNREGGLGALEVRSLPGASQVAVLKEGQLVECSSVSEVLGVVQRGRGLHVIGYNREYDDAVDVEGANFWVLEVEKDGTLHDDLLETSEQGFPYLTVGETHAKNLATFSINGMYRTDEGGSQQHTLTWRYDAPLNRYSMRERKGRYVAPNYGQ
jgi:hypothetical protein